MSSAVLLLLSSKRNTRLLLSRLIQWWTPSYRKRGSSRKLRKRLNVNKRKQIGSTLLNRRLVKRLSIAWPRRLRTVRKSKSSQGRRKRLLGGRLTIRCTTSRPVSIDKEVPLPNSKICTEEFLHLCVILSASMAVKMTLCLNPECQFGFV